MRGSIDADGDVDVFNVTPLWITPLEQGGGKVLSNRCLPVCDMRVERHVPMRVVRSHA